MSELSDEARRWRELERERPNNIPKPGPDQESVWDYPRPPRVEPLADRVLIVFAGAVLADSSRARRVLETASPPTYYIPPEDVRTDWLKPHPRASLCEWKGHARYWSIQTSGRIVEAAAWSYPEPFAGFESILDYLAFYPSKVDACSVGTERVMAQPGDFYGGWITPGILGPFKGEPGTERW